ncbi:unnamed protein product [Musa textilis]
MEGVGARLGRSSTRYGPATVFSGPVRKWKKRWVPLSHPSSSASSAASANGVRSHLLLYKWAPVSSRANGAPHPEEPPPRKFRFVPVIGPPSSSWLLISIPIVKLGSFLGTVVLDPWLFLGFIFMAFLWVCISVIEEQKQEAAEKLDDKNKPNEADPSSQPTQNDSSDKKPDMNDVAMEEAQVMIMYFLIIYLLLHLWIIYSRDDWTDRFIRVAPKIGIMFQASDKDDDINQTNLDLNLGLKATDGDLETKSRNTKQDEGDQPVKASTSEGAATKTTTNSETHNKLKRKAVTPDLEMRV